MLNNKLPANIRWILLVAVVVVVFLLPLMVSQPFYLHVLILILFFAMVGSSFRLILSTGQMNFGHFALVGIGAYTSVILVMKLGFSFWISLPIAGIVTTLVSLPVGIVTLRIKGTYFAIVTLAFGEIVKLLFVRDFLGIFGGAKGIAFIPCPGSITFFGRTLLNFESKDAFYLLAVLLCFLTLIFCWRIAKSRIGLVFCSIAEQDKLGEALGINLMKYKLIAFACGCFIAGIAGSFYAHYSGYISPAEFGIWSTVFLTIYVVVGGRESVIGPLVGAAVLIPAKELLRPVAHLVPLIYGLVLIAVMIRVPKGLVSIPSICRDLWSRRFEETVGTMKGESDE